MSNHDLWKVRFERERFELEKFKLLREEIRYEYNITGLRVAWYLTSQTFFVLSFINAVNYSQYFFSFCVNILGFLLSCFVVISIYLSFTRIKGLHKAIGNSFCERNNQTIKQGLRPVFFPKVNRKSFFWASCYPYFVSSSLGLFWITMFIFYMYQGKYKVEVLFKHL